MKHGFLICLLVFGLAYAAEDNIGAETKDISSKTAASNINFRFYDKNKRGATKLTNADSPTFNHLGPPNTVGTSIANSGGFKPSTATSNPTVPFRYLYNQQYYQPNPYLAYVPFPQASQIAAQYSVQSNPVAHFLQTPNQIQYVAAPTVAHVPQIKFQSFSTDYQQQSVNAAAADSATSSATTSQYVPQVQQHSAVSSPQIYVPQASAGASAASAAVSQTKQVQTIPFYSGYQAAQPVYYTQQPLLTYFPQAQAANFVYQQPNANFLLKQQQQLASLYGANRFGLYTQTPNTQLTYLVPNLVVPQAEQDSTTTTTKSSDKTVSNVQQSASSNSYSFGAKA